MMKSTQINRRLCGATLIATVALVDAAPSKAVLFIDFIPLSSGTTRIKASGSLTPSLLGTTTVGNPVATATSGGNTSAINRNSDQLRFTYASSANSPGNLFAITGPDDPFTVAGTNYSWDGPTTPTNTPPFILQLGTTKGIRLANTLTGCTPQGCPSPSTTALAFSGFFDVNLSLAQIFGAGTTSIFSYASGSEQIILRKDPPQVPGPLPLLGAAAAFGYSRKLRNRIQKSTPSPVA